MPKAEWKYPQAAWCQQGKAGYNRRLSTRSEIGGGQSNTRIIMKECGKTSAASLAASYRGGGKRDWYLPAEEELLAIYEMRDLVGGFSDGWFWSSTQEQEGGEYNAYALDFSPLGISGGQLKINQYFVRPVRAF